MISENDRSDVYINGTSRIYGYDRINKENNQNIDESSPFKVISDIYPLKECLKCLCNE
ncbi:hypothetical protein ENUP19_0001G0018 [Entamoeba nuttalli]|uniref:Uncharacterized protein n=1 Tax=Entamoeba nuttalli TaxID=412467 RepID=A0ABQ0D729_9EUKA